MVAGKHGRIATKGTANINVKGRTAAPSAAKKNASNSKAKATMDYAAFKKKASALSLSIGEDVELKAAPKEFSTGSFGWSASGNKTIKLDEDDDETVDVVAESEISVNITVKGSKKSIAQTKAASASKAGTAKKRKAGSSDEDEEENESE